ncbi:hypothetical protein H5J24_05815 [Chryseobacterium capnotolerans]|uniref:hypothetical protein n=1 Tax=Chryseobacterium TaxID=59732 RepID=UPI00083A2B9C|nr:MULTISPECIES: hypothetical protein [Chryseobacterium]UHO39601.1 hypothetical protein H5J24_05815 [Chryseobacterium capnotolerans]
MKKFLTISSILYFVFTYSQEGDFKFKDRHFPAKYVLKGSNDTVRTRVLNIGVFSNKKYHAATYVGSVLTFSEKGERKRIKESDIQYMEITDLEGVTRKLVSSEPIIGKDVGLLEIYDDGERNGYMDYFKPSLTGPVASRFYPKDENKK